MTFCVRLLDRDIDCSLFQCGQTPLDDYIRRYASQDMRRNVARVFVACSSVAASRLAGFYTLSAGSVSCSDLPPALAKKLPRYPVPVALIGRLAVDKPFQGQGLGAILLADACHKVVQAAEVLAMAGIVVDAKDASAEAFYRHYGFLDLPGAPGRMFLPAAAYKTSV